jgi:hypothetical protein
MITIKEATNRVNLAFNVKVAQIISEFNDGRVIVDGLDPNEISAIMTDIFSDSIRNNAWRGHNDMSETDMSYIRNCIRSAFEENESFIEALRRIKNRRQEALNLIEANERFEGIQNIVAEVERYADHNHVIVNQVIEEVINWHFAENPNDVDAIRELIIMELRPNWLEGREPHIDQDLQNEFINRIHRRIGDVGDEASLMRIMHHLIEEIQTQQEEIDTAKENSQHTKQYATNSSDDDEAEELCLYYLVIDYPNSIMKNMFRYFFHLPLILIANIYKRSLKTLQIINNRIIVI